MLSTLDTGYCIQIRVQFTKMLHLDKWKSKRRLILHIQFKQLISPCTDFRRIPTLKTSGCSFNGVPHPVRGLYVCSEHFVLSARHSVMESSQKLRWSWITNYHIIWFQCFVCKWRFLYK